MRYCAGLSHGGIEHSDGPHSSTEKLVWSARLNPIHSQFAVVTAHRYDSPTPTEMSKMTHVSESIHQLTSRLTKTSAQKIVALTRTTSDIAIGPSFNTDFIAQAYTIYISIYSIQFKHDKYLDIPTAKAVITVHRT